jgi:pimeloyl-ACP methyl ester carboxylesterase
VLGNRSEFYRAVPEGPFYGFNRPGAKPSEAVIANWWRQGMAGSAQAHYETVFSWLEDYTEDLKKITVPVLVMHGEDDQIVPFASSVPRAVDLLANGVLKTYSGFPHGMLTTHAEVLNPDLLEFIKS